MHPSIISLSLCASSTWNVFWEAGSSGKSIFLYFNRAYVRVQAELRIIAQKRGPGSEMDAFNAVCLVRSIRTCDRTSDFRTLQTKCSRLRRFVMLTLFARADARFARVIMLIAPRMGKFGFEASTWPKHRAKVLSAARRLSRRRGELINQAFE